MRPASEKLSRARLSLTRPLALAKGKSFWRSSNRSLADGVGRFGFAKFADVRDSEKCIRGFYHLGYEVGFARESFNARLKAEGDETSTNLYLSNLPKRLNESELNAIFAGYHVVSSKILRDSMGNSRGVGFAR
ncbi:hypothetical protein VTG60DRAFT_1665 [Thermothelomyces hinnuleus]